VGFGCPVDGCGSPYLTWHHFDPPWRDGQTHNPEGMVALCLQHHKEADGGALTHQQLRDLKTQGFMLRVGGAPGGRFNWRREQLILDAGGGLFVRCPEFLRMAGRPMIWLTTDAQGNQLLNLDIWDRTGALVFAMRDNDWVVFDADDVEAPPSARSLIVRDSSKGIRLSVAFKTASASAIKGRLVERERRGAKSMRRHHQEQLIWPSVCQVGALDRRPLGGRVVGVVGGPGRRARCRRCQSEMRGLGTSGPGFVLPACAV
jgi:hypothetical protein